MYIRIAPEYEAYRDFITKVPQETYQTTNVYCYRRNTVVKARMNDRDIIIKRFKRPVRLNQVVYTFFRKNKALRAYENAYILKDRGIDTAMPIAYIIIKKHGLIHTAYFLSEYLPYPGLDEVYAKTTDDNERNQLDDAFTDFIVNLDNKKIRHRDFRATNILCHKENDGYHFALIDANRLQLDEVPGQLAAMYTVIQLGLDNDIMKRIVPLYIKKRGFSLEQCINTLAKIENYRIQRHNMKHALKRALGLEKNKVPIKPGIFNQQNTKK